MITEDIRAHCYILTVSPEITFFYRLIESPQFVEKSEIKNVANAICRLFEEKSRIRLKV